MDPKYYGILDNTFKLYNKLGEGATSEVYDADDLSGQVSKQRVAVKLFNQSLNRDENFQNEVQIMMKLNHQRCVNILANNPNSTLVLQSKEKIQDINYIVMEQMEKGELFYYLLNGYLPQQIARKYFQHLLEGLEYIHSKGYAHRDLKPQNIFLDHEYQIRIGDFGFVGNTESQYSDGLMRSFIGTQDYMAPEVYAQQFYEGKAADIYSLGVILFVMVTGQPPILRTISQENVRQEQYFATLEKELYQENEVFWNRYIEFFQKSKEPVNLGKPFQNLINGMMSKDPKSRYTIEMIKKEEWFNGPIFQKDEIYAYMAKLDRNIQINTNAAEGKGTFQRGQDEEDGIIIDQLFYSFQALKENPNYDLTLKRDINDQENQDAGDIIIDIPPIQLLKILLVLTPELGGTAILDDEKLSFDFESEASENQIKLNFEISTFKKDTSISILSSKLIQGDQMERFQIITEIRDQLLTL